ncbi:MAG: SCP2 sterol-binding domain-containing protein [Candidatus Zhuqueibacterota bacterium]
MEFYEDRDAMMNAVQTAYKKMLAQDDFQKTVGNLGATFGMSITDLTIDWLVTCRDGKVLWEERRGEEADLSFAFKSGKDFYEAFMEKQSPMYFIMTGKLKISGDMQFTNKLLELARPLQQAFQEAAQVN